MESVLEERWSDWFGGLRIEIEDDVTVLAGMLPDAPALYGVLDKLRDLGLSVVDVRRVPAEEWGADDRE